MDQRRLPPIHASFPSFLEEWLPPPRAVKQPIFQFWSHHGASVWSSSAQEEMSSYFAAQRSSHNLKCRDTASPRAKSRRLELVIAACRGHVINIGIGARQRQDPMMTAPLLVSTSGALPLAPNSPLAISSKSQCVVRGLWVWKSCRAYSSILWTASDNAQAISRRGSRRTENTRLSQRQRA